MITRHARPHLPTPSTHTFPHLCVQQIRCLPAAAAELMHHARRERLQPTRRHFEVIGAERHRFVRRLLRLLRWLLRCCVAGVKRPRNSLWLFRIAGATIAGQPEASTRWKKRQWEGMYSVVSSSIHEIE